VRSLGSLRDWIANLLPTGNTAARTAAHTLLSALCHDFTACLSVLARELAGTERTAATVRQNLRRWLGRRSWEAEAIYRGLQPFVQQLLATRRGTIPLLLDITHLGERWSVLQVSVPWEGRALPVHRTVLTRKACEEQQTQLVFRVIRWLEQHLPLGKGRYVLVMDRGFPSHEMIRTFREQGWRYVLRVPSTWKMTHPEYTGYLSGARCPEGEPPRHFGAARLGRRDKGRKKGSQTHVVWWHGAGHDAPWFLVTSETDAAAVVAIYRQRMQIECEFRDLKGYLGLDHLEKWKERHRVASFLAWIAVYEWRLALLYVYRHLRQWGCKYLQVGGKLSWIRITRAWVRKNLPTALNQQTFEL
jgi:hypothetical protein